MTESRTESGIILKHSGGKVRQWKIRIMSEDPVLIDDLSRFTGTATEAHHRAYTLARRASYMVNGPNRWVWGYLQGQSTKDPRKWVQIFEFKTRLGKGAGPS